MINTLVSLACISRAEIDLTCGLAGVSFDEFDLVCGDLKRTNLFLICRFGLKNLQSFANLSSPYGGVGE